MVQLITQFLKCFTLRFPGKGRGEQVSMAADMLFGYFCFIKWNIREMRAQEEDLILTIFAASWRTLLSEAFF